MGTLSLKKRLTCGILSVILLVLRDKKREIEPMTPQENLRQTKAAFDATVDTLLQNLSVDEITFRKYIIPCHSAAAYYAEALGNAAPTVSQELGEAYREEAAAVMISASHLISHLIGYRKRHFSSE